MVLRVGVGDSYRVLMTASPVATLDGGFVAEAPSRA